MCIVLCVLGIFNIVKQCIVIVEVYVHADQ